MDTITTLDSQIAAGVRRRLLELARDHDVQAADEAARVPYWAPRPATVSAHLGAAAALRADADLLLRAAS